MVAIANVRNNRTIFFISLSPFLSVYNNLKGCVELTLYTVRTDSLYALYIETLASSQLVKHPLLAV
jgi:hypothetical protein